MYYFLDRLLSGIEKISQDLGELVEVDIVDNKTHGQCYNNCLSYNSDDYKIINGFYVIMNTRQGVYEFLRHSIIEESGKLKDITDPGYSINKLFFIKTDKDFYDLPIKQFYKNGTFEQDYNLLSEEGRYYVYGLFDEQDKIFYVGKGTGNRATYHLTEKSLSSDANKHKVNKILKIGPENVGVKYRFKDLQDELFAYDLEELTILEVGLDNLTNICLGAKPPNFKGMTYEEIMGPEKAKESKALRSKMQKAAGGYGPKFHSEESKIKMSQERKGEKNGMYGKKHSAEAIKKMSEIKKDKKYSEETNKKKACPGEKNGMYGKKHKRYKCKYCDKEVAKHLLDRWHNENCKHKIKLMISGT